MDPVAAAGFKDAADAYEVGRPEYPIDAVALVVHELGLQPGAPVIDLAAGTGKLTRTLVHLGLSVVAVEPVAGMREKCRRILPAVPTLEGRAESIPARDEAADAVFVGQAFHWFDGDAALAEIARVLRPGGAVVVVFHYPADEEIEKPWRREVRESMDRLGFGPTSDDPKDPYSGLWRASFSRSSLFEPLRSYETHGEQPIDAATLKIQARCSASSTPWSRASATRSSATGIERSTGRSSARAARSCASATGSRSAGGARRARVGRGARARPPRRSPARTRQGARGRPDAQAPGRSTGCTTSKRRPLAPSPVPTRLLRPDQRR